MNFLVEYFGFLMYKIIFYDDDDGTFTSLLSYILSIHFSYCSS